MMQHVKKQWLTRFAIGLCVLDLVLFGAYLFMGLSDMSVAAISRWGITPSILIIAAVHLLYCALVFPLLRKKFEWLSTIISISIYAILFAAIIDTSGNTNLYYRFGYAGLVFLMGMSGPFAPIATIVLTWLIMVFAYVGVVTPTNASPLLNIAINLTVTVAGLGGWLVFRRFYVVTNPQAEALSRLLEQTQHETNAVLESITDGVMIVATDGTIKVSNDSTANMLAMDRAKLLKKKYQDLFHGEGSTTTVRTIIDDCIRRQHAVQNTCLLRARSGREFYVDVVASPIYQEDQNDQDDHPQVVGVVAVLRDVDRKQRQEQSQRDFVATASHEMRTPVASINGFLELALTPVVREDGAKLTSYLEKAHQTIGHLSELLNQLLIVSQSEDNKLNIAIEPIDIVPVCAEVVASYVDDAKKHNIELKLTHGQGSIVVPSNQEQLREVLNNLVSNAIKYTKSGGSVEVSITKDADRAVIAVADTGIGIAENDLPALFQKFHRVDNTATREVGGTGLGLYITKLLVETLRGDIQVQSVLGAGSTFTVSIPTS